jgi:hypothetical protein
MGDIAPTACLELAFSKTIPQKMQWIRLYRFVLLLIRMPFGLIQRGGKIKAVKKLATCAATPGTSSKLAPSLRLVAQTAKMLDRSDSAPVEPPISSRPVCSESVREGEVTTISAKWNKYPVETWESARSGRCTVRTPARELTSWS